MTQHPKLESVPGSGEHPAGQDKARHLLALEEELAELNLRLTERIERERVITLELAASRQDLEVKGAYNLMLESAALERQQHVSWLQGLVDQLSQERAVATAELAAGLERLRSAELRVSELSTELAAERARVSYRISQRLIRRLGKHRLLTRLTGIFIG
jgi:hypothetical protein